MEGGCEEWKIQDFHEVEFLQDGEGGIALSSGSSIEWVEGGCEEWKIQDFPEVEAPTLEGGGRQHTILKNVPP